jgi:predicted Zn-dependent peptidase
VKGVDIQKAEEAIEAELDKLRNQPIDERELQKVQNKTESVMAFEDMSVMNRAGSLAFYELLGDGELMNTEFDKYRAVTADQIHQLAQEMLITTNSNTLWYLSEPGATTT